MFKHSLLPSKFDQSLDSLRSVGRELERVEKSFFNLWRDIPFSSLPNEHFTSPNIDVLEDDKAIKIIADLPGLEEKDIAIEVDNGVLTLRGERKNEKEEKQDNYWKFERSEGYFYRSLQLPTYIDENNVEATLKNGVLKITIPKLDNADTQKKRIAIKQIK
jgi:HSP20 family protein